MERTHYANSAFVSAATYPKNVDNDVVKKIKIFLEYIKCEHDEFPTDQITEILLLKIHELWNCILNVDMTHIYTVYLDMSVSIFERFPFMFFKLLQ